MGHLDPPTIVVLLALGGCTLFTLATWGLWVLRCLGGARAVRPVFRDGGRP